MRVACENTLDSYSLDNWRKIKDYLEKCDATNNDYYRRACAIMKGQKDPGPKFGSSGQ
jgi:hypothetical protein